MKSFQYHILSFSDSHGYLVNQNYALNQTSQHRVSLLASYIKRFHPHERLLIDTGDTIQGSPLMYYHQLFRDKYPHPTSEVYNQLKVDYFIPGNHDFNYGFDYLKSFMSRFHGETLCGNIVQKSTGKTIGKPYDIIEIQPGLKIAIIGLTTDYIPNWERREYIEDLIFLSPIQVLEKVNKELEKEDITFKIVCYHGGFERDLETNEIYVEDTLENVGSRILEMDSKIDLFLTGHQHREICQKVGQAIVIQPASHGRLISDTKVSFVFDEKWKIASAEASLIPAMELSNDESILSNIETLHHEMNEFLDQPIGHVVQDDLVIDDLFAARLHKHKIVTFINQIHLIYSKAMISATSLGNDITGFHQEITIRDVLSTYVYPNTLTVVKITGKLLKAALERNAAYFTIENGEIRPHPKFSYPKLEHYNYDMFDGIHYTIHVSKPVGHRIEQLRYAGLPVKEEEVFTLVLNNYRASGGGEFEMYRGLEVVKEINLDIAELMISYIMSKRDLLIPNIKNIKVEK